jgi:hypothetical protein
MLDYYELVSRFEQLPVDEAVRSVGAHGADELLAWIEHSDVAVRFVPDLADPARPVAPSIVPSRFPCEKAEAA